LSCLRFEFSFYIAGVCLGWRGFAGICQYFYSQMNQRKGSLAGSTIWPDQFFGVPVGCPFVFRRIIFAGAASA
jgi:hypothetical protein